MSFLLPSDLGRLIYGYLQTSCSERLAEEFLNTSDSMKECRKYRHIGFDSRVHDRTLTQMLNEYSLLADLIFENCPEKDRTHLNIVNKLQNLLKCRAQSSKAPAPTATIASRKSRESDQSNYAPEEPVTDTFTDILSHTVNAFRGTDSQHRLQSPSECSNNFTPLKNTASSVSCTVALTPNRETPTLHRTPPRNSPAVTSTNIPINEEHPDETSNRNAIMFQESRSPFKNGLLFGIARSTPTPEEVTLARTSSTLKLVKKPEENQWKTVISNAYSPRVPSPVSTFPPTKVPTPLSSPGQNFPQDMEIDGASTCSKTTVFNVPKTPVKSNTVRERKPSDKSVTPRKSCDKDCSSEKKKETNSVSRVNHKDTRSERTTPKHSPKRHEKAKKGSAKTSAKNLDTENSRSSKSLVKILPKSQPKPSKSYSSTTTKEKSSIFTRPTCSGPVPWDFALRQSLTNGTENLDSGNDVSKKECKKDKKNGTENLDSGNDVSKKECKKDKKNDCENDATLSKAESNKRKHDKKSSSTCKKKRKLEEAKKQNEAPPKENVTEKSIEPTEAVSQENVMEKSVEPMEAVSHENVTEKSIELAEAVLHENVTEESIEPKEAVSHENVTEESIEPTEAVSQEISDSSLIIPDRDIDLGLLEVVDITKIPGFGGVGEPCIVQVIPPTPIDDEIKYEYKYDVEDEEDDFLVRQTISEEIVLYYRVGEDSGFATNTEY